jgi:hypothetical protein
MGRIRPGHRYIRAVSPPRGQQQPDRQDHCDRQPFDRCRTRQIIYHDHDSTPMVGFGATSDHCSGLLGLSSCHTNPTTWHSVQDNQRKQITWRSAEYAQLHRQDQTDCVVLR